MRTTLLLPLALAGLLGGCAVYAPDPSYGAGASMHYGYGYNYGHGHGYGNAPRYYQYTPPPAVIVQPAPIFVHPRPPGGRRFFDRDRDGVPDRYDRRPSDPRRR